MNNLLKISFLYLVVSIEKIKPIILNLILNISIRVSINNFKNSLFVFILQINEKGSSLISRVCEQLDLIEKDYFGLRYVDSKRQRVHIF